jgi:cobalt-zinc-cadmium efflux system outer membrane protein
MATVCLHSSACFAINSLAGRGRLALYLLVIVLAGCAGSPPPCNRSCVSANLTCRTGHKLGTTVCAGQIALPNGASLADGLSEDEAVLIALWNNAAFQELLVELDLAAADLIEAGLLPNPEFIYFFPATDKPFKYAFEMPLEALWLRPIRLASAERESARVCQRLGQAGLDLIRTVRQAYSDALLARGRLGVAEEAVRVRGRVAQLADARVQAGDASVQEVAAARVDALQAQQDVVRATHEVSIAEERLRNLMGVGVDRSPLVLTDAPVPMHPDLDAELMVSDATVTRPDLLAANEAVAAASDRVRLAQVNWVRFLGILDATSGRDTGHEFSPAFRVTLPVFHHNEGVISRAEAALDQAARQRETVRQRIILEVREAHLRYVQAAAELDIVNDKVLPEVEAGIRRAESAYKEGNLGYVVVLETTRQFLESLLRREQLRGDLRRAWAELERSVGRRIEPAAATPPPLLLP